jgi:serine/threonine protein kinase
MRDGLRPVDSMSEPGANPPPEEESSLPPDGPRPDSLSGEPADSVPTARLLGEHVHPTDDSPTVISKGAPEPVSSRDGFSGSLRGRQLAHFELIEPIGVGGMAAVLRARDTQLDRLVALKILPPETAVDPENVRRFHQEARSAAKLDHETIARVFFCGEDQRLHFIAFEFVEGENLRTLIEKRGRLPAAEAVRYMLQIATGLVHAASRGVVHRDIKPSNIIITPAGRAKLVDMGLARSLERSHDDDGLTQSGVTLGTFDYISPEQALEPREADTRSDIYSLGCTFYHAVTGEPPVPEGTAAKKLHHHHHVKPADPRQLAPDIPDAVAGVLGRMMAKRPEDRYQSPEELVRDLQLVARGLGIHSEIPEGLLHAALPSRAGPIRRLPIVLAGLAALLVVGLVFFADPGGRPPRPGTPAFSLHQLDGSGPGTAEPGDPEKERPVKPPKNPAVPPPAPAAPARAVYDGPAKADAIMQWAADAKASGSTELEILLAGDLSLWADDPTHPCPSFEAMKVFVRPKFPELRPTIKLSHRSPPSQPQAWAALTISGDEVSVEGVRFVVDALGGNYEMMGLRLVGRGHYRVKDCEFVQVTPSFDSVKRVASIRAEATGGRSSLLKLEECCFLGFMAVEEVSQPGMGQPVSLQPFRVERGGQDGIVRRGSVRVEASNCAFGPHSAAFRFEGSPSAEDGRADVHHCSVLAGADSAAFDLAEKATADLRVEACLFSRPAEAGSGMGPVTRSAVLIRQATPMASTGVIFSGKDNRYHNLDGAWLTADGLPATDWSDFSRKLQDTGGSDLRAGQLTESPWKSAQPLKLLEQPPPARPGEAFRPNERLADLRLAGVTGRETVVGVERLSGEDFTTGLPGVSPGKTPVLAQRERLVDPLADEDTDHRVYKKLEDAVQDAVAGDVILIRHRDRLPVGAIRPGKRIVDLTIRAAPGCRPELVPTDTAGAASLFNFRDGWLRFEDLDFRLHPSEDTRSLALVALSGTGLCTLKGCVVTLEPGSSSVPLALATVAESSAGTDARPQLSLEGCFIRGEGDVVRDPSGRSFELRARNTLAVLTGSFLSVDSSADSAPPGQSVRVTFGKVTAYLTAHLVHLQAGREQRAPVPVQFEAKACLFVAATGQSLVHLDGPETGEDRLKERLVWSGEGNAYGNLKDKMFDQLEPGDEMKMAGPTVGQERWKILFKEDGSAKFLPTIQFAAAPAAESPFSRVEPPQMRPVASSLKEVGAGPNVPMPASSER